MFSPPLNPPKSWLIPKVHPYPPLFLSSGFHHSSGMEPHLSFLVTFSAMHLSTCSPMIFDYYLFHVGHIFPISLKSTYSPDLHLPILPIVMATSKMLGLTRVSKSLSVNYVSTMQGWCWPQGTQSVGSLFSGYDGSLPLARLACKHAFRFPLHENTTFWHRYLLSVHPSEKIKLLPLNLYSSKFP